LGFIGISVKWWSHWEKQFDGFSKVKDRTAVWFLAIPLLGIYSKELKTETQTDICRFMFIICNKQKVETKMYINRRMAKQNVIYTYNGVFIQL
jgi:hypothetical protein